MQWPLKIITTTSGSNVPGIGHVPSEWSTMLYGTAAIEPPDYMACFSIRSWRGLRCESARWISSPCSLYSKEHGLTGRQTLLSHHKVKRMKPWCGSSAPSHVGPAARTLTPVELANPSPRHTLPYHQEAPSVPYCVEIYTLIRS